VDPRQKVNETEKVTVFLTTHYMDEADRVAHRIGVIDHGKLVAQGTPKEIKEQTGTESLEDAFLKLTGSTIREESASSADQMRQFAQDVESRQTMSAIYILWLQGD
jgi:ABC-2 type transport system ATP-binding protein